MPRQRHIEYPGAIYYAMNRSELVSKVRSDAFMERSSNQMYFTPTQLSLDHTLRIQRVAILLCLVLLAGCGHPADSEFKRIMDHVKSRTTASDLKAAAVPLFSAHNPTGDLPVSELPAKISSLLTNEPASAFFLSDNDPRNRTVVVLWGNGFGHFGIVISPFGGHTMIKGFAGTTVLWDEGVYFYKE